ncbi:MAG: protein NO VEIN domain-containing protein, partial [Gammaproteobacteria bacterium]
QQGLGWYGYGDFLNKLESYLQTEHYASIIVSVMQYCKDILPSQYVENLKNKAILQARVGRITQIMSPAICYLPTGEDKELVYSFTFPPPVLAEPLASHKQLSEWLKEKLGVRTITRLDLIRGYIFNLIRLNGIDAYNTIPLLRFIFETHIQKELEEDDFTFLSNFRILCQDMQELKPIRQCFYLNLTPINNDNLSLIIATKYSDGYNQEQWSAFLVRMHIQTSISLRTIQHISSEEIKQKLLGSDNANILLSYHEYIRNNAIGAKPQKVALANGGFINFIWFEYLQKIHEDLYYLLFWRALENDWQKLMAPSFFHRKDATTAEFSVLHFLIYYLNHYLTIRAKNFSGTFTTNSLYAPVLQENLGKLPLRFADIPISLSLEQAKKLGFKTGLSAEDFLTLLESQQCYSNVETLKQLYLYLINVPTLLSTINFDKWKTEHRLLAEDGSYQLINTLTVYDLAGPTPNDAKWLHACQLGTEELTKLSSILSLPCASKMQGQYNFIPSIDRQESEADTYKKILDFLPLLATLEAFFTKKDVKLILSEAIKNFNELKLQCCKKITHKEGHDIRKHAVFESGVLYYKERCLAKPSAKREIMDILCQHVFHISKEIQKKLGDCFSDSRDEMKRKKIASKNGVDMPLYNELISMVETLCQPKEQDVDDAMYAIDVAQSSPNIGFNLAANSSLVPSPVSTSSPSGAHSSSPGSLHGASAPVSTYGYPSTPQFNRQSNTPTQIQNATNVGFTKVTLSPANDKVTPRNANVPMTTPDTSKAKSSAERNRIGRLGEKKVYDRLRETYIEKYCDLSKYPNAKIEEYVNPKNPSEKGFYISTDGSPPDSDNEKDVEISTESNSHVKLTVIWYNKGLDITKDFGMNHDIKIIKNGVERFIEVKSTTLPNNRCFKLSGAEYRQMATVGDRYRIFRVLSVDMEQPPIEKLKIPVMPALAHLQNSVKIEELKISYTPSAKK